MIPQPSWELREPELYGKTYFFISVNKRYKVHNYEANDDTCLPISGLRLRQAMDHGCCPTPRHGRLPDHRDAGEEEEAKTMFRVCLNFAILKYNLTQIFMFYI